MLLSSSAFDLCSAISTTKQTVRTIWITTIVVCMLPCVNEARCYSTANFHFQDVLEHERQLSSDGIWSCGGLFRSNVYKF